MRVLEAWRSLERILHPVLLSGVTLEMLLWLYAHSATSPKPTGSLCAALEVPRSTVLRWIAVLNSAGLVAQTYDEKDRRLTLLDLTAKAREFVEEWLTAIG